MLEIQRYEGASGTPLLIVHGLFGSGRNWGVIAKRLSDTRPVYTVDMRNHGDSPRADSQTYDDMADDLLEVVSTLGPQVDLIGHSMGGKAAMVAALKHPTALRRLLVADIAPVTYGHSQLHYIEAMTSLDLTAIATRGDADRALAGKIEDASVRSFLLQSLDVKQKRWRLNLDVLAREMPAIVGFPDVKGSFGGPTLFLSGGESDYVLAEHRPIIKALFPKARFAKIPGAGHWLHAEKPRAFEATARVFLDA
ncbi:MAG: alpha/beta fold hydrolase [Maritimibacter sp.]